MEYAVFDCEGTGLGNKDEVIQFSCFLLNNEFNPIKLYNFYCYTSIKSHPKALEVHGITPTALMKLSGGRTFEDNFEAIPRLVNNENLTWVGVNSKFDCNLINNTLKNNGLPIHNFGKRVVDLNNSSGVYTFDIQYYYAMQKYNSIRAKLSKMVYDILDDSEEELQNQLAVLTKQSLSSQGYHDSVFDAFCTYKLLRKMVKKE